MSWRAGYPEKFKYLDDEHEAMAAELQDLRNIVGTDDEAGTRRRIARVSQMFQLHVSNEDDLMLKSDYPEREKHIDYHAMLIDTLTFLLQHFDQQSMAEHGAEIAQHIENKLAEELFVDRQFAEYLCEAEA